MTCILEVFIKIGQLKSKSTRGGTRTHKLLPTPDFESGASTNSATRAIRDAKYTKAVCQ